ncbi:Uncharacterised protein [Porphyromonas cangingivalis]|nr:Uncharacterised protein [Porphyromonas cangingivalis]
MKVMRLKTSNPSFLRVVPEKVCKVSSPFFGHYPNSFYPKNM